MGEIINLNKVRKARAKAARAVVAVDNRSKFGRSKDELSRAETEIRQAAERLSGHKLRDPDET